MKVSHEVPRCLLTVSPEFNQYDYALPHLLDQDEEYKQYFLDAKAKGRYIIMDNSLHELGEAYNNERLIHWINEIKPDEFIIPDVWENSIESIQNAEIWNLYDFPEGVEKVAVVQATTLHEAAQCVKAYKELGYSKICFSYGASYYNDICPHPNKDIGKALGRLSVISALYKTKVISQSDRIHLLGCASPFEFSLYKGYDCIESIDTSNPIMMSLEGKRYNNSLNMSKPKANMNDYYGVDLDKVDLELVNYNVNKFRSFLEV